jgi:hypothetical protein
MTMATIHHHITVHDHGVSTSPQLHDHGASTSPPLHMTIWHQYLTTVHDDGVSHGINLSTQTMTKYVSSVQCHLSAQVKYWAGTLHHEMVGSKVLRVYTYKHLLIASEVEWNLM